MTARARAGGVSGRSDSTGCGRSLMCFISIDGVLDAWKGSRPASIW